MPNWSTDHSGGLPVMFAVWAGVLVLLAAFTLWTIYMGDKYDVRKRGELAGTNSFLKEKARQERIAARDARKAAEEGRVADGVPTESREHAAAIRAEDNQPSPNPLKHDDTES